MKNLKYIMLTSVGFDQLPKEKVLAVDGEVSVGVSEVLVGRLTKIL